MISYLLLLAQAKWTPPYTSLPVPTHPEKFAKRLGNNIAGVFLDGDVLTTVAKGAKNPLVINDWFKSPMTKIEGSDLWIGQAKMKEWDQAFFQYGIRNEQSQIEWKQFRAKRAPRLPIPVKALKGSVTRYELESASLGEKRNVFVYLPPVQVDEMPVVVMADGDYCEDFAKSIEPLILSKKIRPLAIVGIPSGGYRGPSDKFDFNLDFRMREYLKVADPERFGQHLNFICDQVLPWARKEFKVTTKREDTMAFGFSNGGAFSMVGTLDRPDVFGNCLACSVAAFDPKALAQNAWKGSNSKFYFVAGKMELFVVNTENSNKILTEAGVSCSLKEYMSGHDMSLWKLALASTLQAAFPAK